MPSNGWSVRQERHAAQRSEFKNYASNNDKYCNKNNILEMVIFYRFRMRHKYMIYLAKILVQNRLYLQNIW